MNEHCAQGLTAAVLAALGARLIVDS